jgi:hypothetical protein
MNKTSSRLVRIGLAAAVALLAGAVFWTVPASAATPSPVTRSVPSGVIPFVYPTFAACDNAGRAIYETLGPPAIHGWHCDQVAGGWQLTIL